MSTQEIIEAIEKMTLLEVKELVDALQEKFGVTAAVPAVAAGAAPAGAAEAQEEEQTEFSVVLGDVGSKKIQVIKTVRELVSGLGLKEAKELVESAPGAVVAEGVKKEEADQMKAKLEEAG
ncbi:MAG: 50S ribosomal protein L7/L12, partial [Armatimonadota bacterium]